MDAETAQRYLLLSHSAFVFNYVSIPNGIHQICAAVFWTRLFALFHSEPSNVRGDGRRLKGETSNAHTTGESNPVAILSSKSNWKKREHVVHFIVDQWNAQYNSSFLSNVGSFFLVSLLWIPRNSLKVLLRKQDSVFFSFPLPTTVHVCRLAHATFVFGLMCDSD